jgi:hypothetical protein
MGVQHPQRHGASFIRADNHVVAQQRFDGFKQLRR